MQAADTPSTVEPKLKTVNYHGAMLMKGLFEFERPDVFADSFLMLSFDELLMMCGDQLGSYVVEGFLKSPSVSFKKKHKIIKKLKVICLSLFRL